jgi:6-phosphofructokinase 1
MGAAAIQALQDGQRNVMVGIQNDDIVLVPLSKAIHQKKDIKEDSWQALQALSI